MNARNQIIDITKGIAIIFVVVIHLLSALYSNQAGAGPVDLMSRILQHLTHNTVPLFIGVSGFLLAKSYAKPGQNLGNFIRKRLNTILPQYLLWTLGFQLFFRTFSPWARYYQDKPWWFVLFLGGGDYHLYFIPLIAFLYLIFPFLFSICKRKPALSLAALGIIQVLWYHFVIQNPVTPFLYVDQFVYRLPFSWIFYFALGIVAAQNPPYITKLPLFIPVFLAISGLGWAIYQGESLLNSGRDIILATLTTRVPIMIYSTGCLLITFSKRFQDFKQPQRPVLAWLGRYSYLIFLSHTMPIWIIQYTYKHQVLPWLPALVFIATLITSVILTTRPKLKPVRLDTTQTRPMNAFLQTKSTTASTDKRLRKRL